jgi:hypothetical protein
MRILAVLQTGLVGALAVAMSVDVGQAGAETTSSSCSIIAPVQKSCQGYIIQESSEFHPFEYHDMAFFTAHWEWNGPNFHHVLQCEGLGTPFVHCVETPVGQRGELHPGDRLNFGVDTWGPFGNFHPGVGRYTVGATTPT